MSTPFNLQRARINAGLSQRQLALEAGVSRITIQRLEAGEGAHPANAKKVADFFEIQVTDLMAVEEAA